VGGHCIAVDPYYLIDYAQSTNGFDHKMLALARRINNGMPKFTVDTLVRALKENKLKPKGLKVAVLGLAYKGDIDDCRESPSYEVIKELKKLQVTVKSFDPYVKKDSTVASLDEALTDVQAVIIATAHKEFKQLSPDYLKTKGIKIVIDGRNCLDKSAFLEAGLAYYGIGR
jgi:nucleotide sugar dehydrogenase